MAIARQAQAANMRGRQGWTLCCGVLVVFMFIYAQYASHEMASKQRELEKEHAQLSKHIKSEETSEIGLIQLEKNYNRFGRIRNQDKFPVLAKDHVPIVLYVYNRPHYLTQVLENLSKTKGIEETVLFISHDTLNEDMFRVVEEKATFCQVKEWVHPTSPTHKPSLAALKEHWWWIMNWVWHGEESLQKHEGEVVFIEEDHAVTPDFYYTLKRMIQLKKDMGLPNVWGLAMSPYYKPNMENASPYKFDFHYGFMNTGYAYNRTVWEILKSEEEAFVQFPDGWDLSMVHLMQLGKFPDVQLFPRLSRVYNIGQVGINVKVEDYTRLGLSNMPVSDIAKLDETQMIVGTKVKGVKPADMDMFEGVKEMKIDDLQADKIRRAGRSVVPPPKPLEDTHPMH